MDKIVNWLLLTIIFVFDPLAIALVIAANFAFEQIKTKKNIYGEDISLNEDFEVTLNDGLEEEIEVVELTEEEKVWDANNDGVLDEDELKRREDAMLNDPSISQWRKNKILKQRKPNNPNQITY
jgi:hypothetical protein